MDEPLGFGYLMARYLTDSPRAKNTQIPLADMLSQAVYGRTGGYEGVTDAERHSQDPTFRLTQLSCHRFRSNEVRLLLSLIATT